MFIGHCVLDFELDSEFGDFGLDDWLLLLSFPFRSLHFISFHVLITFFEQPWKRKEQILIGNKKK